MLDDIKLTMYYEIDALVDENKEKITKNLRSKPIRVQERLGPQLLHLLNYKTLTTLVTDIYIWNCAL